MWSFEVLLGADLRPVNLTFTLRDTILLGLLSRAQNLKDNINIYVHNIYDPPLIRRCTEANPESVWSNTFTDQTSILAGNITKYNQQDAID